MPDTTRLIIVHARVLEAYPFVGLSSILGVVCGEIGGGFARNGPSWERIRLKLKEVFEDLPTLRMFLVEELWMKLNSK